MTEPAITVLGRSDHMQGPNLPVSRVVIHATSPGNTTGHESSEAGMAHGTALYFQSPSSGGLAHYVCDVAGEEHCCPDDTACWHAPPNPHSIGIEICGLTSYTRDDWLSVDVWPAVRLAAARTRELCDRLGIPMTRLGVESLRAGAEGICGHADVSLAFKQSDHTDPGPGFPWDHFMAEVLNAGLPPDPNPAQQPQEEDMPLAITVSDPDTGDTWTCRTADGAVFADGDAPFLGGYNGHPEWGPKEPVVDFALWKDDDGKWGYKVITSGKDALHFYRFPRNGSLAH